MRIKEKTRFVIGVIDLLGGIACLIACIYLHRGAKAALTFVPIICGVVSLMQSIRTEKYDVVINAIINRKEGAEK